MNGFMYPTGNSDPKSYKQSSLVNSITVEAGKKYMVSVAIASGYSIDNIALSNCTVISSSGVVQSDNQNYRAAYLKTFLVKATGTALGISYVVSTGGATSASQAITCYEV